VELEPGGKAVKRTVMHGIEHEGAKFIVAVSAGWPQILPDLKALLATGAVALGAQIIAEMAQGRLSQKS
jgi:hypothetical protein